MSAQIRFLWFCVSIYLWCVAQSFTIKGISIDCWINLNNHIGDEIFDLESFSSNFTQEAAQWSAIGGLTSQLDTVCNSVPILGGFGVLPGPFGEFVRSYTSLPYHVTVLVSFNLWLLDQRNQSPVSIRVGNGSLWTANYVVGNITYVPSIWTNSLCGDPLLTDMMSVKVFARFIHTGSLLIVKIRDLSSATPSKYMGLRDLKILLSQEPRSSFRCTMAQNQSLVTQYACECQEGQYFDAFDALCKPCDTSCTHCFGATSRHCYVCNIQYVFNGTHCLPCDFSCQTCYGLSPNQCLTCKPGDILFNNGTCRSPSTEKSTTQTMKEIGAQVASVGLVIVSVLSAGSSSGVSAAVFAKMMEYIKYINVTYSEELENALKTWQSGFIFLDFGPKMPEDIQTRFVNQTLPYNFMKYEVNSSFLVNFWESLTSLAIFVVGLLCCLLLENIIKRQTKISLPNKVVKKLKIVVQNFFLMLLYNSFGDIFFFSMLELRSAFLVTFYSALSFMAAIVFMLVTFGLLSYHVKVLRVLDRRRKEQVSEKTFNLIKFVEQFEGFEVFFKDFKDSSFTQQAFLLFFSLRDIMFSMILTTFFEHSIVEPIMLLLLNIAMLLYLFVATPFKDVIDLIQQIFNEIVILIINSSVLAISCIEYLYGESNDAVESLSKLIIVVNLIYSFSMNVFLLARLIVGLINAYQARKKKRIMNLTVQSQQGHPLDNSIAQISDAPEVKFATKSNLNTPNRNKILRLDQNNQPLNQNSSFIHSEKTQPLETSFGQADIPIYNNSKFSVHKSKNMRNRTEDGVLNASCDKLNQSSSFLDNSEVLSHGRIFKTPWDASGNPGNFSLFREVLQPRRHKIKRIRESSNTDPANKLLSNQIMQPFDQPKLIESSLGVESEDGSLKVKIEKLDSINMYKNRFE